MKILTQWERMPMKKEKRSQPRKFLISSFTFQNGTMIALRLLIYLELGIHYTTKHRFVEYTPRKCFNSFVQSSVNARRQGEEKPNSSVVAETMKLVANNSFGYQNMDCSRQTVLKYLSDEKHMQLVKIICSKS